MSSKTYYVEGELNWAKLFERNKDTNEDFHGEGGAYTVDVKLEQDQLDILTESGCRLKPKIKDDGVFIKFKRKHTHPTIEALGGPPQIVDAEGDDWNDEVSIGNGSKGTVAFEVYETKMGMGTRLTGVKVNDLVEYESDYDPDNIPKRLPFND